MTGSLPDLSFPVTSQDDILRKAAIVRQWWVSSEAREFNNGDTGPVGQPPDAVTIQCGASGEVVGVVFARGAKASMTDAQITQALARAATRPVFVAPPLPDGLGYDELVEAAATQTAQVAELFEAINQVGASQSVTRGSSRDGAVRVGYRGRCLCEAVVTKRDWALFASEHQIEEAVIEASRAALGMTDSSIGLSAALGWKV